MKFYNITFVSLLFILLNVNIFVLSQSCDKCGSLDAICSNGVICGDDLVCAPNGTSIDSGYIYTCQKPSKKGEYCINDDSCEVGLACQINKCDNLRYAQIGEKCTKNEECSYDEAYCVQGYCNREKNMNTCTNNYDCDYGSTCGSDKVCVKVGLLGESCNSTELYPTCVFGLICGSDEKCAYSYTKDEGESCLDDSYCKSGLYCNAGKCQKYKLPTSTSCSNTTSCDAYHTCFCGDNTCYQSSPLPTQASDVTEPYLKCAVQHKCHPVRNMFSPNSCLSKNCGSLLCNYAMTNVFNGPLQCGNSNNDDQLCSPNSSSKVSFSLLSLFILFFVYILS